MELMRWAVANLERTIPDAESNLAIRLTENFVCLLRDYRFVLCLGLISERVACLH
jgi:hypothetical protein